MSSTTMSGASPRQAQSCRRHAVPHTALVSNTKAAQALSTDQNSSATPWRGAMGTFYYEDIEEASLKPTKRTVTVRKERCVYTHNTVSYTHLTLPTIA